MYRECFRVYKLKVESLSNVLESPLYDDLLRVAHLACDGYYKNAMGAMGVVVERTIAELYNSLDGKGELDSVFHKQLAQLSRELNYDLPDEYKKIAVTIMSFRNNGSHIRDADEKPAVLAPLLEILLLYITWYIENHLGKIVNLPTIDLKDNENEYTVAVLNSYKAGTIPDDKKDDLIDLAKKLNLSESTINRIETQVDKVICHA